MLYDIITVFWRDWLVLRRRLVRYILSRMISPVMYLVAFGWGLGRSVPVAGGSYLDYIVPGIVALNSMNISFNSVGSPLNMSRLYHKTLEEYLIAPISSVSLVVGKILSGVVRGLISSGMMLGLAYIFGSKAQINGWFLTALTLNCLVFSAMAVVAAMLMDSHEEMANFNTYVLMPMSFLCATFFAPDHLPAALKYFIELLPLTHASYALRSIAAGGEAPLLSLGVMSIYVVLFTLAGIWLMEKTRD